MFSLYLSKNKVETIYKTSNKRHKKEQYNSYCIENPYTESHFSRSLLVQFPQFRANRIREQWNNSPVIFTNGLFVFFA